jgi:glycogen synthase
MKYMSDITCSIIINTYNRAPYLRRLLAGLGHLRGAAFEVVVVNGPSTDGTAELLEQYRGHIKVVECSTRNLSRSRNLGIAAAAGDVVIFIDDDALPGDADWVRRYAEVFAAGTVGQVGAAGGSVLHRDTHWIEFDGGATSDYGFQVFNRVGLSQINLDNHRWLLRVQGCNCAFRRSALVAIGGFDEFFVYYHDETDVCLRLARAGFATVNLPDNPVRHYPALSERRISKFDRNWRVVTRSDTYFALKNGADPLPLRLGKTLAAAPRKHYVGEINSYIGNGEISAAQWLRLVGQWGAGLADGLRAGLRQPRQLGDFTTPPAPFRPFARPIPERRLQIALLTQTVPGQPGYGGVARYTFDLAQGLHERGHELHIICRDEQLLRHESLGFAIHGIAPASAQPQELASDRPVLNKNLSYSLAVVRKLADLHAQGIVFDVVHASNWDAEAAALIRAQIYPTVLMLVSPLAQVVLTENWQPNDDLRLSVALDRWQIEHADTICIPSEGVLSSYQSLMGVDPQAIERLRLASLGIVPDLVSTPIQTNGPRKLLFVGRCERRKGAHTLLDALPGLLATFPGWECHLVGNDQVPLAEGWTLKERFLQQHRGAPWLSRVIFHGSVPEDELRRHYRSCDLFVAPSLFESFGLIYHEAMQYGKAVVGCRTGGVPEVVTHGVEGLLVTPNDPDELRAALAQLMSDDDLRQRMGQAGARHVHHVTNYRTMAERMEQVYLETIASVGAQRQMRQERAWPREIPLFASDEGLQYSGSWVTQDAVPGQTYRRGEPGATLHFAVNSEATLRLVALRHDWSGVLEIRAGDAPPHYVDLYKSGPMQLDYTVDIQLEGTVGELIDITLRVHPERYPESRASEVWLKRIAVLLTAEAVLQES